MARVTIEVCDLCGDGETRSTGTPVPFEVGAQTYEVDVCTQHQTELTELQAGMQRFAVAGRLLHERKRRRSHTESAPTAAEAISYTAPAKRQRTDPKTEENRAIREFARMRGIAIGDRGRIPQDLREQWKRWRWEEDHPVEAAQPVPAPQLRPVPSPPPSQPRYMNPPPVPPVGAGRRLDPETALAVHSEGNAYRR